jgi:hypothetical protein
MRPHTCWRLVSLHHGPSAERRRRNNGWTRFLALLAGALESRLYGASPPLLGGTSLSMRRSVCAYRFHLLT